MGPACHEPQRDPRWVRRTRETRVVREGKGGRRSGSFVVAKEKKKKRAARARKGGRGKLEKRDISIS